MLNNFVCRKKKRFVAVIRTIIFLVSAKDLIVLKDP